MFTVFSVKVQYRYESQLTDELDLMVGDVVSVLDDKLEDDGWWFGELRGRVGVFPNNFVEVLFQFFNNLIFIIELLMIFESPFYI